ncbi:Sensor histidine kinase LiaS [compost metagenome]
MIYYGVFATAAFSGGWLRSFLAPWALGARLLPQTFWQLTLLLAFSHLSTLFACEIFVARRRSREAWLAANERLERDLARSRSALVEADDRLRREASEHLHGEVQSRLLMAWALLDQLRDVDGAQATALLDRAQDQLDRLQWLGLRQARELLGVAEAQRPLSAIVAELVERFRVVMPVTLATAPEVPASEAQLGPELHRAAACLVEEGLLNAFRHARAKRVVVRYERPSPAELVLVVEDDGVGFAPGASPKGLGLSGLGADLKEKGGRLDLDARPGRGTRLVLRLPLNATVQGVVA